MSLSKPVGKRGKRSIFSIMMKDYVDRVLLKCLISDIHFYSTRIRLRPEFKHIDMGRNRK